MDDQTLAVIVALGGALFFALASVLQQRAASTVPDDDAMRVGLLAKLVRQPLWLLGSVCDTIGYAGQAIALGIGALMVVQPLLVTTLLFALPLGRWINGRRITRDDWLWAAVLTIALGVFIDVGNPDLGVVDAPFGEWLVPMAVISAVSVVLTVVGMRSRGSRRALALAVAAGLLFGLSSALTKSVMGAFDEGLDQAIGLLLGNWETYALAVSISVGFLLQQTAYQAGSLTAALPAVVTLDPVVSMLLGAVVLAETLEPGNAFGWVAIVAAAGALALATLKLALAAAASEEASTTAAGATVAPAPT